jgi:hypothetical protein
MFVRKGCWAAPAIAPPARSKKMQIDFAVFTVFMGSLEFAAPSVRTDR